MSIKSKDEENKREGGKKLVFEQLLEDENLEGIAHYVVRNKRFISNTEIGENILKAEGWDRTRKEWMGFNLRHYKFLFTTTIEEWYDTREDDGCSSGWTTKNAERELIIKDKGSVRLRIVGSKYVRQLYHSIYDLIEHLVEEKK